MRDAGALAAAQGVKFDAVLNANKDRAGGRDSLRTLLSMQGGISKQAISQILLNVQLYKNDGRGNCFSYLSSRVQRRYFAMRERL